MFADSRPDVNLKRMLGFGLPLRRLINLPVAGPSILRERDGALVAENHVMEVVTTFQDAFREL